MPIKGLDKIQRKALELQKAMTRRIPVLIQNTAVRHFRDNFKQKGFVNNGLKPWKPVARPPGKKGAKPNTKILVQRALLLNSIRPGQVSWNKIEVVAGGSHVPYARVHNEGGTIRGTFNVRQHTRRKKRGGESDVRPHTRTVNTTIPKRQFMGDSAELRVKAKAEILKVVAEIMKP